MSLEKLDLPVEQTRRPINPGAEQWVGVPIPCLDHGFVYLVDYMGGDEAIVQAARVSYGRGITKRSTDRALIRYLMRHRHTTPFEMLEFKFHAKMPIFVAREWIRHRTANVNEYSGRYSILDNEFYLPEPSVLGMQSASNRQGRGDTVPEEYAAEVLQILQEDALRSYAHYEYLLNDDGTGKPQDITRPMLAKELSRMKLSLDFYTQWYWKLDLHNLFHFVSLRSDAHAQYEIRVYSDAIGRILADAVPVAWEAFVDYTKQAMQFSRMEVAILRKLIPQVEEGILLSLLKEAGLDPDKQKREAGEFIEKYRRLTTTDGGVAK